MPLITPCISRNLGHQGHFAWSATWTTQAFLFRLSSSHCNGLLAHVWRPLFYWFHYLPRTFFHLRGLHHVCCFHWITQVHLRYGGCKVWKKVNLVWKKLFIPRCFEDMFPASTNDNLPKSATNFMCFEPSDSLIRQVPPFTAVKLWKNAILNSDILGDEAKLHMYEEWVAVITSLQLFWADRRRRISMVWISKHIAMEFPMAQKCSRWTQENDRTKAT